MSIDPGLQWLQDNAYFFNDLSLLGGGLTLANGNNSFEDISANNRDCIIAGTPTRLTVSKGGYNWSSLNCTSTNALNLQYNGYAWQQANSFRWLFIFNTNDGQPPTNPLRLFGSTLSPGGAGLQIIVNTNGTLRIDISDAPLNTWTSSAAILANGASALLMLDITFDFVANTIAVLSNGANVAGSWTAGNISAYVPASYAVNHPMILGNKSTNGSVSTANGSECRVVKATVVPATITTEAINYFKKLQMPSYSLSPDAVIGDMIALQGLQTSLFGGWIYNDIFYYGTTTEINPGDVRQYDISAFQFNPGSQDSGIYLGVILTRAQMGLTGSEEGFIPMGGWVKDGTIYLFGTVGIQNGGNDVGLCTAPENDPLNLTYQGVIISDGTNLTRFNHGFFPFLNPDDPTYLYSVMTHRDNDTLPLKIRIMKSLLSGNLQTWSVVYNNIIFTTDSTENLVYSNIERIDGVWKLLFGSFNTTVGGFSIWQTASNNLEFFPEGNELLPPNMTDEEYTSKPLLSADKTRLYYARRAGGASTNYIGIRVKLSQEFIIEQDIY